MKKIDLNNDAGLWSHKAYQSGTQVVTSENHKLPHYYVYADDRSMVCKELVGWLNFGERPAWADSLEIHPKTNECCEGSNGITISAVGPMVDTNGDMNWHSDPSKGAERVALIRALLNHPRKAGR